MLAEKLNANNILKVRILIIFFLNPYLAKVPNLYPLKTTENLWFSGVFRGYKMGTSARNGLIKNNCFSAQYKYFLTIKTNAYEQCIILINHEKLV